MKSPRLLLGLLPLLLSACDAPVHDTATPDPPDPPRIAAHDTGSALIVTVDGELFTEYRYAATQKYPYFFPVIGPASGTSLTTESSEPYPHHHSLFFGCDRVSGGNYWQQGLERGQIVQETLQIEEACGERVAFTTRNTWNRPDAQSPFRDERRIAISTPAAGVHVIDFEITLTALEKVTIQRTNHALFSARVVPELAVTGGGQLVNDRGESGEEATFGKPAHWMDYWGERDGVREGLAILEHPSNRWAPTPWFTRDYGFFSPTPMHWLEGGRLVLPQGECITLRYRVLAHAGSPEEAQVAARYQSWAAR